MFGSFPPACVVQSLSAAASTSLTATSTASSYKFVLVIKVGRRMPPASNPPEKAHLETHLLKTKSSLHSEHALSLSVMLTWQPDSLVEKATYVLKLSAQQLGATGE